MQTNMKINSRIYITTFEEQSQQSKGKTCKCIYGDFRSIASHNIFAEGTNGSKAVEWDGTHEDFG